MNKQGKSSSIERYTLKPVIASLAFFHLLIVTPAVAAEDAVAAELKRMRAQMERMMQRIQTLEAQLAEKGGQDAANAAPPVDAESGKSQQPKGRGTLELKSGDTVLNIGGRITMDVMANWPDGSFSPGGAPLIGSGEDKQLTTHLKNSRLWLKTYTPTPWGPLRTLVEGDFNGSAGTEISTNSHNFRLRHAYFQVDNWTAGQNWSTFVPYVTADTLLDPAMMAWIRQPQVRWTYASDDFSYDLALENPETTLTDSLGGQVAPSDDQLPDLVGRVTHDADWGAASAALLLRHIRQDRATLSDGVTQVSSTDEAFGWGLGGSAKFMTIGKDDVRFGGIYGKGVGRYLAANAYDAGTVNAFGNINLQTSWGGYAAYRHWWDDDLRSSIAISMAGTDNDMGVAPGTVNKEAMSFQTNLFWTPFEDVLLGLEYGYIKREQENGQTGKMGQLYLRGLYNF